VLGGLKRRLTLALGLALLFGCGPADSAKLVSDIAPGLSVRGSASFSPDDHLVEILVHEGHVYAANSWSGVGVLRLEPNGGLEVVERGVEVFGEVRCTSLAVHRGSDTLYCAGDSPQQFEPRIPAIEVFDLADPGHPERLEPFELMNWSVRDIVVVGDTLLVHQLSDGLWTAKIAADGSLGELEERVEVEGNARTSVVVGERVVMAFADPEGQGTQLRLYEPDTWTERARLSLAGPPLGLSAEAGGARVAVGLGSGGAAIVEVGPDSLHLGPTLEPPAVVTHALVEGDLGFAITLSGVFAYALDGPEPRLFGFGAEGTQGDRRNGGMMHGLLHEGELLTSDWTWIERWAVDPAGEVVALDVPRGIYVPTEGPVRWQLRNPGPLPLRAEFWYRRQHLFDVDVASEGLTAVELPAKLRADLGPEVPRVQLNIRVHDPSVDSEGEPLSTSAFVIAQRRPEDPIPPAVGDIFPPLSVADPEAEPFTLPLAEGTQTIWFPEDCALVWPQLEDQAWLVRSGHAKPAGRPVVLTDTNLVLDGFVERWAIGALDLGLWGLAAPPEINDANAAYGDDLFGTFYVPGLPGDASIMNYVISADGRVRSLERMYRGPWSLALPWPWD
jgi:hypothetical protein